MAEQRTGVPLADGLFWASDTTKTHPERYITILGCAAPLSLNKVQALALFRIMLSHLAQIAGDELQNESLLQLFHFSMDCLTDQSDTDLEDRQVLKEALEQYYFAYDFREDLMSQIGEWEAMLSLQYDRLESAASKIDVDLEDLADEEEDELEDETPE